MDGFAIAFFFQFGFLCGVVILAACPGIVTVSGKKGKVKTVNYEEKVYRLVEME